MAEVFQAGDTVRLKSGGPLMTASEIETGGRVFCQWFDEQNKPQARAFSAAVLVKDDGVPSI